MQGRLSRLIAGVPVADTRRRSDFESLPPPLHSYSILYISRSGSTWLADLLSRQGDLGKPREYLNLDMIVRFATEMNANTLTDYFAMLGRRRTTANRVFGLKVGWAQLKLLAEEELAENPLAGHAWIYLRRRNFVAQAVSLYKARVTRDYQRRRTDTANVRRALDAAAARVAYDAGEIERYLREIFEGEREAEKMIAAAGLSPVRFLYEDIMAADPVDVVGAVHRLVFGTIRSPGPIRPSNIEQAGSVQNLEFENRFRAAHRDLIAALERERTPLVVAPLSALPPAAG
jgi:LPS sulfotransferase NodH